MLFEDLLNYSYNQDEVKKI